jgi:hypothetical protein
VVAEDIVISRADVDVKNKKLISKSRSHRFGRMAIVVAKTKEVVLANLFYEFDLLFLPALHSGQSGGDCMYHRQGVTTQTIWLGGPPNC